MNLLGIPRETVLVLLATTLGCGASQTKDPVTADPGIKRDCQTNIETAAADLKQCAAGAQGACEHARKDLQQVAVVHPPAKDATEAIQSHLAACEGKGDDNPDCKAASDGINNLKCE